ncbi:LPXTG cell wall anchor domain-containing protein [Enterococcus sp. LJL99]
MYLACIINEIGGVRIFPQTGEVVMKWLLFVGIAIILLVFLFVFVNRKKGDKEKPTTIENLNTTEELKNEDKNNED